MKKDEKIGGNAEPEEQSWPVAYWLRQWPAYVSGNWLASMEERKKRRLKWSSFGRIWMGRILPKKQIKKYNKSKRKENMIKRDTKDVQDIFCREGEVWSGNSVPCRGKG